MPCFIFRRHPQSACGAALEMLLRCKIFRFAHKELVRKKLLLHIFKTKALHRVGKAFACDALFTEQKNGLFHNLKDFFFVCKHSVQIVPARHFFALATADIHAVTVGILPKHIESTFT